MTEQNPITPSPELVTSLRNSAPHGIRDAGVTRELWLINQAYAAGADQELEANSKPTPNLSQIRTSLVKRVHSCIVGEPPVGHMQARSAIREVSAWLRERAGGTRASWLLDNELEQ